MWRGGQGGGEILGDVVDVCSEAVGVEDKAEFAVYDFGAAVGEFGGWEESYDVSCADGVEFIFASFAVVSDEGL